MKLTIRTKDVDLNGEINQYVREKIGSLDKYYSRIMDGFVELEKRSNHHKNGPIFHGAVDLRLPRKVLRSEKNHVDLMAVIDGIKDELKKQIKSYKDQHEVKEKKEGRLFKQLRAMTPVLVGSEMTGVESE